MVESVANGSELVPRARATTGLSHLGDRTYGAQGIANSHKHQASWGPGYAAAAEVEMESVRSLGLASQMYQNGSFVRKPFYPHEMAYS